MITPSIIIPFASRDPRRQLIFNWVAIRWVALFPHYELVIGDGDPDDFNRSQARNRAVEQSNGNMLIITDADTICNSRVVIEAIERVASGKNPWTIAHTMYWSLTKDYTDKLLEQDPAIHLEPPWPCNWRMDRRSQAGVLVMMRESFNAAGGYDERFRGWGYEDNAFATVLERKVGRFGRVTGDMLHLWHDPGPNFQQPHIKHNEALYEEIKRST